MKNVTTILSVFGLVFALAMPLGAQVKILPPPEGALAAARETVTVQGTVETIDAAKRHVNVKTADGKFVAIDVPKSATRFNELKVGDKVKVTYSNTIIVQPKNPGDPPVDQAYSAKGPGTGEGVRPGGSASVHRVITATITEIDKNASSITFTGPNNFKYSRRVFDPTMLDKVKVGDRVDIIWNTDASIDVS